MSLLSVSNLAKYVGDRCLFAGLTFQVDRGRRFAVVGRNGEGKTTLLRILAGEIDPDEGTVNLARGVSVGYLSQDPQESGKPVLEEVLRSRNDIWTLRERLDELEKRMHGALVDRQVFEQYARLTGRFEDLGGWDIEHRAAAVLAGLGLPAEAWALPVSSLSGGQKVRVNLAKLLLAEPDVLILDEPTNHLDISGTEWLEGYLSKYRGGVVLVSHDRYFMDRLAGTVIEIERGRASVYTGNYSAYLEQKESSLRRQERDYRRQQEFIEKTTAFINRWKANARRAGQARSREKALARLDRVERPRVQRRTFRADLTGMPPSGREVLVLRSLSKSFPGRELFRDFSCLVLRGERIALAGQNGCGKTTFLRCLQGLIECNGEIRWGHNVSIAYFSQDLDSLSLDNTVLEEVRGHFETIADARNALGRFLFSGQDVEKRVRDLSGGERNRLCLLKVILSKPNVLLLDEPTNHLDIPSREALENALLDFPGTVLFASHDRYFIDRLATRLFVFEGGRIIDFAGNYSAWKRTVMTPPVPREQSRDRPRPRAPGKAQDPKEVRENPDAGNLKGDLERLTELESAIEELEDKERHLASILSDPASYGQGAALPWKEWGETRARLRALYGEWEELATRIERTGKARFR